MNTEYNTVYGQFEKIFKEQAESFIPEDDIKITLKMEKIRFENAEKYNISINKLTGNNLARYTKDAIRRRQPLFFVYYTLSIVTGFCYFLLMWSIAKCIFLYFTGTNKEAFSDRLSFSVSLIFFAVAIICNSATHIYTRKLLFTCKGNIKAKISLYNAACSLISAIIIIISALFIYLNTGSILTINLSLSEVFIITVAMLALSGIHNVIYSSHFTAFMSIGYAIMLHRKPQTDKAISHYKDLSLKEFLSIHGITTARYKEDSQLQAEFNKWLRSKAVTLRTYSAIAFFIAFILAFICLRQLIITGISASFIIFTIAALIITVILFLSILSCSYITRK
ncbi:MAG: hypothetical protein HFH66_06755 [Lachnospiraceae bacterium]|jgi:hypothetical protein|nr:hypothetical protein [Lachnospiraceae bacterium]